MAGVASGAAGKGAPSSSTVGTAVTVPQNSVRRVTRRGSCCPPIRRSSTEYTAQQAAAPSASRSPRGSSFKTKAPLKTTRITPVKAMRNPSSVRREKRSSPAKWARMAVKMGAAATMMLTFAASVWVRAVFSV